MKPVALLARSLLGILASCVLGACASSGPTPTRDGGRDRTDAPVLPPVPDAGGPIDAGAPDVPLPARGLCEPCTLDAQCSPGSFCGRIGDDDLCVPGCPGEFPMCPRGFVCVEGDPIGVPGAPVCIPSGRPCCIDDDGDGYGAGGGCLGADCDDGDPNVRPGAAETCNAVDDDCDGSVDGDDTECASGVCREIGSAAGTFESLTSATCTAGTCERGDVTECGLFVCDGPGGESGVRCLSLCDGAASGTGDDACIAPAHCDGTSCLADLPDGGACDEDSDCASAHCENGTCCAEGGLCCATSADCPGSTTSICTRPGRCEGERGDAICSARFTCEIVDGVPDDTACTETTLSTRCGLNLPVYCSGEADQTAPECPTDCASDADCIAEAHCETSGCAPDRPAGGLCARSGDCRDGLSCIDGVCCTSACDGTCEACNVAGSLGTCTPVPAGTDAAGECPALDCDGFYDGFASSDVCLRRSPVSAEAAVCDGVGACVPAAVLCPLSPPSTEVQVDCDDACETPLAGSCRGDVAGVCVARDDGSVQACGIGACRREVPLCEGGARAACVAASPTPETCNGVDDDCDAMIDDAAAGTGAACDGSDTDLCAEGTVVCRSAALVCSDATTNDVESCNTADDDCDGRIDEGVRATFYRDADADGFGSAAAPTTACTAPAGYVANATDCDDARFSVRPGATEACNGIDEDCDGRIDEGVLLTFYRDDDADGYGRSDVTSVGCAAPTGFAPRGGDCLDTEPFRHPGLAETCDALDNDCDGNVDGTTCRSGCSALRRSGHSYMFCGFRRSYGDARTICSTESMRLVRIDDSGENTFVRNNLDASLSPSAPEDGWIGGTDTATESRWVFEDGTRFWNGGAGGSAVAPITYTPWASGEPNDDGTAGEDCMESEAASSGRWNDTDCARSQIFACERW